MLTGGAIGQPYIVAAKPLCDVNPNGSPACDTIAYNSWTSGEIIFFQGLSRRYHMRPRLPQSVASQVDLTLIAIHEFGHGQLTGVGQDTASPDGGPTSHLLTEVALDPCIMQPGSSGEFQGFCTKEIRNVGRLINSSTTNLDGTGYASVVNRELKAVGPVPSAISSQTTTAISAGISGSVLAYGTDLFNPSTEWQLYASTKALSPAATLPPVALAPGNAAWSADVATDAVQRPALVFDQSRNAWFMVVRQTLNFRNMMRLYKNVAGTPNWVNVGLLQHSYTNIESQYPPGLAVDNRSTSAGALNNLVMVWSSSEGNNTMGRGLSADGGYPLTNTGCNAPLSTNSTWLRHCKNEILGAVITPDGNGSASPLVQAVTRYTYLYPQNWGYVGLGSPSIICDPPVSGVSMQCQIYVVNATQWKEIVTWRQCVNATGFCGFGLPESERANSSGETDFPVAVSSRRLNGDGRIMEAIVGTDRKIYWRTKASVQSVFPGWTQFSGANAVAAPSAVRSLISDTYVISYAQE
jgi:hypothetical protein